MDCKKEARNKMRKLLANMDLDLKKEKSILARKHLNDLLFQEKFIQKSIGGYFPLDSEVNYLIGNSLLIKSFAKMADGNLVFKKAEVSELVEKVAYGQTFKEPVESAVVTGPEILIIPGLGFSLKGDRLGRGKGYYDRYLENKTVVKIGICFHEQLVDEVPVEDNDIRMDFIITDKVLLRIN